MLELKSAACLPVDDYQALEISREALRSLLSKIETELFKSEVYSSVLTSLQGMLGETATSAELILKAVSREAIRLTFQGFTTDLPALLNIPKTSRIPESATTLPETPDAVTTPDVETTETQKSEKSAQRWLTPPPPPCLPISLHYPKSTPTSESSEETAEVTDSPKSPNPYETPPTLTPEPFYKRWKRLSKAEQEALAIQEREKRLREIGQILQAARNGCSLSLKQLHRKTMVPVNHLESLEKGEIERLPEDVYVRGFIRRIGNSLGLNGDELALSLPAPAPQPITTPWSEVTLEAQLHVKPIHLYLGYTALMAGAVGSVAWLSQQSTGASIIPNIPQPSPEPEASSPSNRYQDTAQTPGITTHQGTLAIGSDIAPPDIMAT